VRVNLRLFSSRKTYITGENDSDEILTQDLSADVID